MLWKVCVDVILSPNQREEGQRRRMNHRPKAFRENTMGKDSLDALHGLPWSVIDLEVVVFTTTEIASDQNIDF
ncbi:hypothetical protein TREES_T100020506 [Tupaia chinensis]|uniref:Uncharacterized protein n=1 Tax=Tupaia chinensis TaxID=246437 RepID=L9KW38_TUPCH|nr:hypothetical protein TREES_T100020506 [Tupaia chinensis]